MADLSEIDRSESTKMAGADPATGIPSFYAQVSVTGSQQVAGEGTAGTPAGGVVSVQGVSGGTAVPISAAALPLPSGAATSALQTAEATLIGAVTETAPASDTASSGLNGRLQRIAQRLTSLIGQIPATLGQKASAASLAVALSTEQEAELGIVTETSPASDTASSGLNGRLQRIAQRLTSIIALLPASIGQKASTGSLSVVLASDQVPTLDISPATQNITAFDSSTTTLVGANGQVFYVGSPTANSSVQFSLSGFQTVNVLATILGGGGTLVVEVSMDGASWFRPNIFQLGTTNFSNVGFTSPFECLVNVTGITAVRVRAITSWTGSATIKVVESAVSKLMTISESALPVGASTSANQTTEISSLQILDDVPTAQNGALVKGTPIMGQLDDTSTTAASEDAVAAARITPQRAIHTNLRDQSGTELGTNSNPLNTSDDANGPVTPGTVATKSMLAGGQYNSSLPSLSNGQQAAMQFDSSGRLIISPVQSSPLPATGSGFSFGDVATSSTAQAKVERTAYTEQVANSTMSIASSSALDTAAGTGARTVTITYLDASMTGLLTTTVSLNGTTFVNLVAGMCYIEKIVVSTVGSGGQNAGILTLKATTAGGGATVGTVGVGDNQTFWVHHYVPTGKTSYISGFTVSNNQTVAGNGAVYLLAKATPTVANTPVALQISDFHTLAGQNAASISRTYLSPIQVAGPAKITAYVIPLSGTAATQRASFDYIDN